MQSFLLAVLVTVSLLPGLSLRYAPVADIISYEQKRTLWWSYVAAAVANIALLYFCADSGILPLSQITFLGSLFSIATTLINILVIRGYVREQLYIFGIIINFSYLLMTIPSFLITRTIGLNTLHGYALATVIFFTMMLVFYRSIRKLLLKTVSPFLTVDCGDYWNTIWMIPLALYLVILAEALRPDYSPTYTHLLDCALLGTVMVVLSKNLSTGYKRLTERQALVDQLTDQKLHYSQLQTKMQEARKYRHDFQHHVTAIQQLAAENNSAAILEYCDTLVSRSRLYDHIPYTGNAAVDGVLYRYIELAQQNNVDFHYAGTIHSRGIADIDLCVLLGNALENALTGCLTLPENRSIRLVAQSEAQTLSLLVCNTFDGTVMQRGDDILSRKRTARAGVGLASMRSICERYGGTMDTTWDETQFTVVMLLNLS